MVFFRLSLSYSIYLIYTIYIQPYFLDIQINIHLYIEYILNISHVYNNLVVTNSTNPSATRYYYSKYILGIYRAISNNS